MASVRRYPSRRQNSNSGSDLLRRVPFVKVDAALRENYAAVANASLHETPGVSRHGGFRQFGELRVTDRFASVGFGNENVQARAEYDRQVGIPRAQAIEGRVAHDQAAEIGGADSGLRVPAITSGCKDSSRIGVIFVSCFG